ncbi:hypothetical protein [Gimesia aquarii]|uniref:Uncharacterized protein n=1 Tax=Gimesia aquarii TaxID=2527964 RepID=A0A517VSL8_9PLAN|nr:hypothetical protein [Gimesia aquarii]QDT96014.1 hypothetical protein V144x_14660 [Gimesia aquarii]
MSDSQAIGFLGGFLCAIVIILPIALLIGAVILRAAISMFNKLAGKGSGEEGQDLVPEPSMLKAMGILLITGVANAIIGAILGAIGAATGLIQAGEGGAKAGFDLTLNLISLPFTFLVSSALLAALLPTTFKRGMGVALCQYIVTILVGLAIGLIAVIIGLAFAV